MNSKVELGQLLDGRFKITALLAEGAMSTVYEALDRSNDQTVAVKIPHPGADADLLFFSRFQREEEIGRTLSHPSIVRVFPVDQKSRPYIVMERLRGKPLSELVKEGRPIPVGDALKVVGQIARALVYLHGRGVIHRDLKPGNIIVCRDGSIRLIDLGLAKDRSAPDLRPPILAPSYGTPDYMPPEQVQGKEGDARSDLYSLGVILYELVTGRAPFEGPNLFQVMNQRVVGDPSAPSTLNPDVPKEVEEIILHAMERDPDRRYSSAADLLRDLENPERVALTGRADRLVRPSPWLLRWRLVSPTVLALLAILAAMVAIVLVATVFARPHVRVR